MHDAHGAGLLRVRDLTARSWFAGNALSGIQLGDYEDPQRVVQLALEIADMLLAEQARELEEAAEI